MRYLAALDHEHLDNGVFLTSLARSLAEQQQDENISPIIIHTDSEYTERIIQTGVMREEATTRSLKDLNKRLVALFADQGVSTIGINPYKKNFITLQDGTLSLDQSFLADLPNRPVLLLSTLVQDLDRNKKVFVPLSKMFRFLSETLEIDEHFIFSKSDEAEIFAQPDNPQTMHWGSMDSSFKESQIPDELEDINMRVRLTSARDFNQLPEVKNTILIE